MEGDLFERAARAEASYRRMLHLRGLDGPDLARLFAGSPAETLPWLKACAVYGHAAAQLRLGQLLLDGAPGVARDQAAAFAWFLRAARGGSADAENMAGRCLENGWGTDRDLAAAADRYRRAAEAGLDWGQYNYANLLFEGWGVERDQTAAVAWWGRAADQGHARAMTLLARAYEEGWGVAPDPVAAARWRRRSAEAGDWRGQFNLGAWLADRGRVAEAVSWLRAALAGGAGESLATMRRMLASHPDPRLRALAGAPV